MWRSLRTLAKVVRSPFLILRSMYKYIRDEEALREGPTDHLSLADISELDAYLRPTGGSCERIPGWPEPASRHVATVSAVVRAQDHVWRAIIAVRGRSGFGSIVE